MNEEQTNVQQEEKTTSTPEQQPITFEAIQNYLNNNPDTLPKLKLRTFSEFDSKVNQSIENWKEKNLQKLVDEKYNELHPPMTEEQKEIREIKQQLERAEKEKLRETMRNEALRTMTDSKLPTALTDFFVGEDIDSTKANILKFNEVFRSAVQSAVEERFKANGRQPEQSPNKTDATKPLTAAEIENMTTAEINAIYNKNPERFKNIRR